MAAASDKLAVVNTAFLDRTILGTGAANFLKGTIWGGAVSVSQAVGSAYFSLRKVASAEGKAVDMSQFKKLSGSNLKLFAPIIIAHSAAFTTIRGNTGLGVTGMLYPLAIVSIPAVAWSAYKRTAPPQSVVFALYGCVLLHLYDRVWHPKGLMTEHMPVTKLLRRVY